jgi:hypothetical protein
MPHMGSLTQFATEGKYVMQVITKRRSLTVKNNKKPYGYTNQVCGGHVVITDQMSSDTHFEFDIDGYDSLINSQLQETIDKWLSDQKSHSNALDVLRKIVPLLIFPIKNDGFD